MESLGTNAEPTTASKPLAACTIIARNYLSHARILAESFRRHHPGSRFYLFVVDRLPGEAKIEDMIVIHPEDLALSYYYEMCFKYDVTELSTAVKPTLLKHIMDRYDEDIIVYFDPDILITRPLKELSEAAQMGDIVLTPHLLKPIPRDGKRPSEEDILIAGAYNLGFVALRKSEETDAFLRWWEERLRDACRVDPSNGLMVDQRWIDLVPSLFPSTFILRDDTYNIAYWNLHSSTIERDGDRFLVNGRPLAFFHFSGFNPTRPRDLSKHQDRHQIREGTALAELLDLYIDLHMQEGYLTSSKWPYAYSRFDNGAAISAQLRQLYLDCDDIARERFGDPFHVDGAASFYSWAISPDDTGLSPFLDAIYRSRYDVAAVFPDVHGKDREAFLHWAQTQGAKEMGYDPQAVAAVAQSTAETDASSGGRALGSDDSEGSPSNGKSKAVATSHRQPEKDTAVFSGTGPDDQARHEIGVNVSGYLRNESGLGAAVRGYVEPLRFLGVPLALNDLSDLSVNRSEDESLSGFTSDHPHYVNLICVNADQHFVIMSHLGEDYFKDRYNIGIWAWELPSFPEKWHDRFDYYDEIWVGTSYIVNTLAPISSVPVVRVPPVMMRREIGSRDTGRRRLGVSAKELLYTFVFDFHSYFERKNPLAVIDAFRRVFARSDPVRLVIKCVNEDRDPEAFAMMQSRAEGYPISILAGYWRSNEVQDLMAACDVYVSLHRAEGTGLTISDAMALGKPVIATGWSGNMDFMTVSNSFPVRYRLMELKETIGPYQKGAEWADPSVDHAAELMRYVFDHREVAAARGEVAKRDIEAHLSCASVAKLIRDRLSVIKARRVTKQSNLQGGHLPAPQVGYQHLVTRVRRIVQDTVPDGATVAVISKGDEALLALDGRAGWHFPRALDGTYPGYYPADDAGAIAHLEALRTEGAQYLLLPSTAFWWLGSYGEFARHLDTRYRRIWSDESCIVHELTRNESDHGAKEVDHQAARVPRVEALLEQLRNGIEAQIAELSDRMDARITDLAKETGARVERTTVGLEQVKTDTQGRIAELAERTKSRIAELAEELARVERAEAGLEQLRTTTEGIETRVAAREAWAAQAEAQIAELAKRVERQDFELSEEKVRTERTELGLQQLYETARAMETQVRARETWAEQAEARIAELTNAAQKDRQRLDGLIDDVTRIRERFAARPYMAKDPFSVSGDLSKPMGYALDAANLANGPRSSDVEFADLFRGSEEFITERQRSYLRFFRNRLDVIDLGCGRGEFLRLLSEIGIDGVGVELDSSLVERGREQGLEVIEADALAYLRDLQETSLDGIFSAQFIEHLTTPQIAELLNLAKSRLREGGVFIAETVNPESFEAQKVFYVDLSHQRPIFPQVLLYLCRRAGFRSARVFYPQGGGLTQERYDTAGEYAVIAVA